MRYQQHHSRQNLVKNWLWFNKKTEWESSVQIWNKNNSWYQKHDKLYWMICYENDCITHLSEKEKEYFSKASKNYREKKETKWAIWNTERTKISHQVDKFSEKFNDKSKFLRTRQEEIKKQMKATSFWWEQKVIYNSKSVAQQLASMKDSEKHYKSEKSKKKSVQKLLSDASEVLID